MDSPITLLVGDQFIDGNNNEVGKEKLDGYKLIMILWTTDSKEDCKKFKDQLKNLYNEWNKDGAEKNI